MTDIDSETLINNALGSTGRYQILITLYVFLCRFPDIWHQLLVLIIAPPVGDFTCANSTMSKCDRECPLHKFDHSIWESTIIYEWDLVCDRAYLLSIIQGIMMFGVLVGNLLFGYFADRFGRRKPLTFCVMVHLVAGISAAFASSLWMHTLLRFLCNVAVGGTIVTGFSIITEFTDRKYRAIVSILFAFPSKISFSLLGLIGYLSRRWDHIQLIVSIPSIILLGFWCLLPESPRWLLTTGKGEHVIRILETGAKCNNLPINHIRPQVEQYLSQDPTKYQKKGGNIVDLFRTKRMRIKTIIMCFNWLIISMSFLGIALYIGQISGNMFLNIAVAGILQMFTTIFLCLVVNKMNRKFYIILFYTICFISMFIISALPEEKHWLIFIQVMGCVSIMGISGSFSIIFLYSGELYPTIVRTIAMGVSSMSARIGAIISPFLMDTRQFGTWIPPFLLGIFPVIGATLLFFCLPETKGSSLPDTVEDADKL